VFGKDSNQRAYIGGFAAVGTVLFIMAIFVVMAFREDYEERKREREVESKKSE
jgi:hypothetical protein